MNCFAFFATRKVHQSDISLRYFNFKYNIMYNTFIRALIPFGSKNQGEKIAKDKITKKKFQQFN